MMKASLVILAAFAFLDNLASAQCNLCGDGFEPTMLDDTVDIQGNAFTCSQWASIGLSGSIPPSQCGQLTNAVFEPCGCNATGIPPTEAPTFGPPPDCYTELDDIRLRERRASGADVAKNRTYVLCPNTDYVLGRQNAQGQIAGGSMAISPRPNVHYKCGDDGSSANKCIIKGGEVAVTSVSGDAVHSNVVFEGLTFEKSFLAGGFFNRPGDITFVDCIFRVSCLLYCIHSSVPFTPVWKILPLVLLFSRNTKTLEQSFPSTLLLFDVSLRGMRVTITPRSWKKHWRIV
jgi:hypothetical protein